MKVIDRLELELPDVFRFVGEFPDDLCEERLLDCLTQAAENTPFSESDKKKVSL